MKRLSALLTALLLGVAGLSVLTAAPAGAAVPCVSYAEYASIVRGMPTTRVHGIFDTSGYEVDRFVDFVYDGTSDYDEHGNWVGYEYVDDGYYDEWGDWIDTSYEQGGYAREVDTVRSYKKCARFDGGRGRVGINFDNYTSNYSGNRVYTKTRYTPSRLLWWYDTDFGRNAPHEKAARRSAR